MNALVNQNLGDDCHGYVIVVGSGKPVDIVSLSEFGIEPADRIEQ